MKNAIILLPALAVAACTGPQGALYGGNFGAMFAQMEGSGTLLQKPDGSKGFRYVIQSNAFEGMVEGNAEELRKEALGRWLGTNNACGNGYVIDKRTHHTQTLDAIIYEGHCK